MRAIKRGDDRAARDELMAMKASSEEINTLGADAHVLRSLIAEVHEFLREHSSRPGGQSDDDQATR